MAAARVDEDGDFMLCEYEQIYSGIRSLRSGAPVMSCAALDKILQIRRDVFAAAHFTSAKNEKRRQEVQQCEIDKLHISGKAVANLKNWQSAITNTLRQESISLSDLLNLDELSCLDLLAFAENALGGTSTSDKQQFGSNTRLYCAALFAIRTQKFVVDSVRILFELRRIGNASLLEDSNENELDDALVAVITKQTDELVRRGLVANVLTRLDESASLERRLERDVTLFGSNTPSDRVAEKRGRSELCVALRALRDSLSEIVAACAFERKFDFTNVRSVYERLIQASSKTPPSSATVANDAAETEGFEPLDYAAMNLLFALLRSVRFVEEGEEDEAYFDAALVAAADSTNSSGTRFQLFESASNIAEYHKTLIDSHWQWPRSRRDLRTLVQFQFALQLIGYVQHTERANLVARQSSGATDALRQPEFLKQLTSAANELFDIAVREHSFFRKLALRLGLVRTPGTGGSMEAGASSGGVAGFEGVDVPRNTVSLFASGFLVREFDTFTRDTFGRGSNALRRHVAFDDRSGEHDVSAASAELLELTAAFYRKAPSSVVDRVWSNSTTRMILDEGRAPGRLIDRVELTVFGEDPQLAGPISIDLLVAFIRFLNAAASTPVGAAHCYARLASSSHAGTGAGVMSIGRFFAALGRYATDLHAMASEPIAANSSATVANVTAGGDPASPFGAARSASSSFVLTRKRISPRELEALVVYSSLVQQLATRNEHVRVLLGREQDAVRACCTLLAAGCSGLADTALPLALRTGLCRMLAALCRDRFDVARFVLQTVVQTDAAESDLRLSRLLFVDDDIAWSRLTSADNNSDGATQVNIDDIVSGDLFEFEPDSEFESTRSASVLSAARAFVSLLDALCSAYRVEITSRGDERHHGASFNASFDGASRTNSDLQLVGEQLGRLVDYAVRFILPRSAAAACYSAQFSTPARSKTARVLERERERGWLAAGQLYALLRTLLDPFVVDARVLQVAFVSKTRPSELALHALVHFLVDEAASTSSALRVALALVDAAASSLFNTSSANSGMQRAIVACAFETLALLGLVAAKQGRFFESLREVLSSDSADVRASVLHSVRFEPIERGLLLYSGSASDNASNTARIDSFLSVARFARLAFEADSLALTIGEADRVALAFVAVDLLARCAAKLNATQHADLAACIWQRSAADRTELIATVCDCVAQLGVTDDADSDDLVDEDAFASRLPRSLGATSLTGSRCALLFELAGAKAANDELVAKSSIYRRVRERMLELLLVSLAAGRSNRSATLLSSTVAHFVLFGAQIDSAPNSSSAVGATQSDVLLAVVAFLLRSAVRFDELVERLSGASAKYAALPSAAAHSPAELCGAINDLAQFVEHDATAFELACRLLPAAFAAESQSTLLSTVSAHIDAPQLHRGSSSSRLATLIDELVVRWFTAASRCMASLKESDAVASRVELVDEARLNAIRYAITACFAQLIRVAGARLCGPAAGSSDRTFVQTLFGSEAGTASEPLLLVALSNLVDFERLVADAYRNSAWLRDSLHRLNVAVVEQNLFADETAGESESIAKLVGIVESPPLLRIGAIEAVLVNELGLQNADTSRSRSIDEIGGAERERDELVLEMETVLRIATSRNRLRTAAFAYCDALESAGELLHLVTALKNRPAPIDASTRRLLDRITNWTFEQLNIALGGADVVRPLSVAGSHRLVVALSRLGFDAISQLANATISARLLERIRGETAGSGSRGAKRSSAFAASASAADESVDEAALEKRNASLINLLQLVTICLLKTSDNDMQLPGSVRVLVGGALLILIDTIKAGTQPQFPCGSGLSALPTGGDGLELLSKNVSDAESETAILQRAIASILEQAAVEASAGEPAVSVGASLFNSALCETIDGGSPLARTSGAQLLVALFDAAVVRSSASWLVSAQRSNLVRCLVDALADANRALVRASDTLLNYEGDAASPDEVDALLRSATAARCLFAAMARIAQSSAVGASCLLANGALQTLSELSSLDRLDEATERPDAVGTLVSSHLEMVRRGAFRLVASLGHGAAQTSSAMPAAFRGFLSAHIDALVMRTQRIEQSLAQGCAPANDDVSPFAGMEPSTFESLFEFSNAMRASITAALCMPDAEGSRVLSEQSRLGSFTRQFVSLLSGITGLIRQLDDDCAPFSFNGFRHAEQVADCVPLSLATLQRAARSTLNGEEAQCERTLLRCCVPAAASRFGSQPLLANAFERHATYMLVSSASSVLQLLVALGSSPNRAVDDAEGGITLESVVGVASLLNDRAVDTTDSRRISLAVFVSLLDVCATLYNRLVEEVAATIDHLQALPADRVESLFDSAVGDAGASTAQKVNERSNEKQAGALLSIASKLTAIRVRTAFKIDSVVPLVRMLPIVIEQALTVLYLRVSSALSESGSAPRSRVDAAEREQLTAQRRDRLRSELRALVDSSLFERIAAIASDAQTRANDEGQSAGVRLTDAILSRFRTLAHST